MRTPTKQQWQTVIDNLKKVLPKTKKRKHHLDMTETDVNDKHVCGTVHCVGGWYAVATLNPEKTKERITYTEGGDQMAIDLGFSRMFELELWAQKNQKIWGNECGAGIFSDEKAYNNAETLAEVITHLEGVRDRSPKK